MTEKPPISGYHALIKLPADSNGLHERASLDASDLSAAKAAFEARYGAENVVGIWGDWEASQVRSHGEGGTA